MKIGRLSQRIRIEQPPAARDPDYGTVSGTWTTFATVWAEVQDVLPSKTERVQGDALRTSSQPTRVRIRYLEGLTPDMRVVMLNRGDRLMRIVGGPAEIGRREGMEIMVEAHTTQGDAA